MNPRPTTTTTPMTTAPTTTTSSTARARRRATVGGAALLTLLTACGSVSTGGIGGVTSTGTTGTTGTTAKAATVTGSDAGTVTVTNCGQPLTFPTPARRVYVYDGGMISMLLSIGAAKNIAGIAGLDDDKQVMERAYGADVVAALPVATDDDPTLENVIATRPDVMLAGWNYGWDEDENLTPASLSGRGIAGYTLTESCRQGDGEARGTVAPWDALRTDLTNLGRITGHEQQAAARVADIDRRLARLAAAPRAATPPTVFLFDSGTTAPFTSGAFGGPQAIIDAAGGRNVAADLSDTWTTISWERVVAAQPDFIAMVDYPGQTFEAKVAVLRSNPSTQNLPAVREGRFLNLPYAAWVSGPLNINAAEQLRQSLEAAKLVPASDIRSDIDLVP